MNRIFIKQKLVNILQNLMKIKVIDFRHCYCKIYSKPTFLINAKNLV